MRAEEREHLVRLMAAMADGDATAALTLVEQFGDRLGAVVRRHLRSFGRWDLLADQDEIAGLTIDAAFAIAARSRGWSPAGAAPWVWAELAIRSTVARAIGHATVELHDEWSEPPAWSSCFVSGVDSTLERLADSNPRVELLSRAIAEVGSARDQAVHIEYRVQKGCGDRSPAQTVGRLFDLSPDNVRQIDLRMRRRLRALAVGDDQFRPLLGLAWLAA